MVEVVAPKIADISSIKGVSALLALPMLCVAYFLQTGAAISWDDSIWFGLGEGLPPEVELRRLIVIFVLKSVWASFFGVVGYAVLTMVHIQVDFPVIQLTSVVLIAFALFGIFCSELFDQLKLIAPFWFYGLVVWGVFLSSMKEQLNAERRKIEEGKNR
ncbi:hypothetical protein [Achromobacter xylosoxidans]|uniref:hypothetical protein n=1 Tax=Alcaligenes xylosoxydans xylosoxydans TaxID=85698 RepID=UPI001178539A|nr:hypothetical protein [Achromobacter xylosoxidans]